MEGSDMAGARLKASESEFLYGLGRVAFGNPFAANRPYARRAA